MDQNGFIYLISLVGPSIVPPHIPLVLNKYSPAGDLLWSRTFETPGRQLYLNNHSLAISPLGTIFLSYSLDCQWQECTPGELGDEPIRGHVLVKLDADGYFVWQRTVGDFGAGVVTDNSGNALNERLLNYGDRVLDKYGDEGTLLWSRVLEYGISSFQVDSADNLLLGGLEGVGVPVFLMVDSSGTVLWRRSLTGADGRVSGVAFASDGTALATGYFYRSFTWAGTEFSYFGQAGSGGFLLAADAKGSPLWGQQLNGVVDFNSVPWVEVNRLDQIVVAFHDSTARPTCFASAAVSGYDLAGTEIWRRRISPDCNARNFIDPRSLAIDGTGRVSVIGEFSGTIDFGKGNITAQSRSDVFLLNLAY